MLRRNSLIAAIIAGCSIASPAFCGEIKFEPEKNDFELSVNVRDTPFDDGEALAKDGEGNFVFEVTQDLFRTSGYSEKIFTLQWTPLQPDHPARGVKSFSLDLPVVLRAWTMQRNILIKSGAFAGISLDRLNLYERLSNPQEQWLKFFASLQQFDHFSHRVRPTLPEARRALNTAVDGLVTISRAPKPILIGTPPNLSKNIEEAFVDQDNKRISLMTALQNVDSLIWKDVLTFSSVLAPLSCDQIKGTFSFLDERLARSPEAFDLQFNRDQKLYSGTKSSLIAKACGG